MGLCVQKGPYVGGVWYRNQDAFIILLGMEVGLIKIDIVMMLQYQVCPWLHQDHMSYHYKLILIVNQKRELTEQ